MNHVQFFCDFHCSLVLSAVPVNSFSSSCLIFLVLINGFVSFLLILSTGQTQIRRVRLPRIADGNGNISYEELVGLVVVFTFPDSTTGAASYNVSLTYYDVDGKYGSGVLFCLDSFVTGWLGSLS